MVSYWDDMLPKVLQIAFKGCFRVQKGRGGRHGEEFS